MYIRRLSQKEFFYYEINTFDAFRVPVRLTVPISVIKYCISEVFIITKDYGKSAVK